MLEFALAVTAFAVSTIVSVRLSLAFLLVVYLKGGKDDLEAAANALSKIRNMSVVPSIHHVIEAWKSHGNGS